MQKKLIALAIAGLASTAAFAQTNVTVYGIADGTFDIIDSQDGRTAAGADTSKGNYNRVSANSSYIGFKGTEDLGNGLKALFQFESSVGFDGASGTWAARDSYVGLSSNMGTVLLGNLTGPTRALGAALDVNSGATGIGTLNGLSGKLAGSTLGSTSGWNPNAAGGTNTGATTSSCATSGTCTSIFDTRWSNAIAYVSPTFAGFSVVGAYVADENKTAENAGATTYRTTGFDSGLKYANGPWLAAVTYNWAQIGDVAGTTVDNVRVGGAYMGQGWSLRAMWEETSAKQEYATGARVNSENKQQKWGLGGTYMIGKANLLAQYYQALESDNSTNDGAQLYEVGVEYSLSKRTMLKASYAAINNDDGANFDFGVNAVGQTGTGAMLQGVSMGVRHAF